MSELIPFLIAIGIVLGMALIWNLFKIAVIIWMLWDEPNETEDDDK